jgi:hypothetical protein
MVTENEENVYRLGLTNGAKLVLLKMQKRIREKPSMFHPLLNTELKELVKEVNEFPTIKEKGLFAMDPETDDIAFINDQPATNGK